MAASQVTAYTASCPTPGCGSDATWHVSAESAGNDLARTVLTIRIDCLGCDPVPVPLGPLPLREAVVASTAAWLRKVATA